MKNNATRTIRSEEITIDVRICAALAANRDGEVYLAAIAPDMELTVITLDEAQQRDFLQAMDETQNAPSLSQAQRMKKLAQEEKFTYEAAFAIMGEAKKDELDKVVIKNDTLKKYFPRSYTPRQMEDVIIKLLEQWQRRQQRQNER